MGYSGAMRRGGGRDKGARFERGVARQIREAYDLAPADVWRTPQSGGHRADSVRHPGDIQFVPWVRAALGIVIECKHYKRVPLAPLLTGEPGARWNAWLEQACKAAGDEHPCLIARIDGADYAAVAEPKAAQVEICGPCLVFPAVGRWWRLVPLAALLDACAPDVLAARPDA